MQIRSLSRILAIVALALPLLVPTAASAAHTPDTGVTVQGKRWFLSGANVPYVRWKCDFGCGANGGVRGNSARLSRQFATLHDKGVKVVRWYAFPGDAWQVRRSADGTPVKLRTIVYGDFDEAVRIARQHDIYIQFVLFSDTRTIPESWMTDPLQREALAKALVPLFARYRNDPHVMAWEIFNEPERGIDGTANNIDAPVVRATVKRLATAVHARSQARVTVGSIHVGRLNLWKNLGLDFFSAHWFTPMRSSENCARCTTYGALASKHGLGRPVVISAMDMPSNDAAKNRYRYMYRNGYAGAYAWSLYRRVHPSNPGVKSPLRYDAAWRFMYSRSNIGPRARPLNPCIGPNARALLCPDFNMSQPSNLFLSRTSSGRVRLMSRNSLNNVGTGPAELYGRRSSAYRMRAVQKVRRRAGGKLTIRTGATLAFKPIPGQYRYWKWKDAATFELWRIDGAGRPTQLVRRGPKTVYCLRDLRRTRPWLARSPARRVFPACSQDYGRQSVTLGTSVGWSDIYPATYHENWVDVTNLRGCFAYVHIADPDNRIYEANERNNTSWVTVRLPYQGGAAGCPNARNITTTAGSGY